MKYLSSYSRPQISTVMQHQNLKHKQANKQAWWHSYTHLIQNTFIAKL